MASKTPQKALLLDESVSIYEWTYIELLMVIGDLDIMGVIAFRRHLSKPSNVVGVDQSNIFGWTTSSSKILPGHGTE